MPEPTCDNSSQTLVRMGAVAYQTGYDLTVEGLVEDPQSGTLFLAEAPYRANPPYERAVLSRSDDGGATWNRVYESDFTGYPLDLARTSSGRLIMVGADTTIPEGTWFIQISDDEGVTWQRVGDIAAPAGRISDARNVHIAGDGSIYVLGSYHTASATTRTWLLRRSLDNGLTWQTIDEALPPGGGSNDWTIGVYKQNDTIYYAAEALRSNLVGFVLRKSIDSGANWTEVFYPLRPFAFHVANETIYVAGQNPLQTTQWVVVKSENQGTTWSDLERVTNISGVNLLLAGTTNITTTRTGDLVVTGLIFHGNPVVSEVLTKIYPTQGTPRIIGQTMFRNVPNGNFYYQMSALLTTSFNKIVLAHGSFEPENGVVVHSTCP